VDCQLKTRAFQALAHCRDDVLMSKAFVPVGIAVYFVLGITGQDVVQSALWSNALVCLIAPALLYGTWQDRMRCGVGYTGGIS